MMVSTNSFDDTIAREHGRLLAMQAMVNNPEQKKVVEAVYGIDYCRRRYPECYQTTLRSGTGKLFDRMKIFLTQ